MATITTEDILRLVEQRKSKLDDQAREVSTRGDIFFDEGREKYSTREIVYNAGDREKYSTRVLDNTCDQESMTYSTEVKVKSEQAREACKHKNIETYKHGSRDDDEDRHSSGMSKDIRPSGETPSDISFHSVASLTSESNPDQSQKAFHCSEVGPEQAHKITGIHAQHAITAKGVKASITIQTAQDAIDNQVIKITAELKRSTRLRELKHYAYDDESFTAYVDVLKEQIQDLDTASKNNIVIGRCHEARKRSSWIPNTIVIGVLENNILSRLVFYYMADEYEVVMDQELSNAQRQFYHSSGLYGEIVKVKSVPTLFSLPRYEAK